MLWWVLIFSYEHLLARRNCPAGSFSLPPTARTIGLEIFSSHFIAYDKCPDCLVATQSSVPEEWSQHGERDHRNKDGIFRHYDIDVRIYSCRCKDIKLTSSQDISDARRNKRARNTISPDGYGVFTVAYFAAGSPTSSPQSQQEPGASGLPFTDSHELSGSCRPQAYIDELEGNLDIEDQSVDAGGPAHFPNDPAISGTDITSIGRNSQGLYLPTPATYSNSENEGQSWQSSTYYADARQRHSVSLRIGAPPSTSRACCQQPEPLDSRWDINQSYGCQSTSNAGQRWPHDEPLTEPVSYFSATEPGAVLLSIPGSGSVAEELMDLCDCNNPRLLELTEARKGCGCRIFIDVTTSAQIGVLRYPTCSCRIDTRSPERKTLDPERTASNHIRQSCSVQRLVCS